MEGRIMNEKFRWLQSWKFHLAFIFVSLFVDQATKIWAVAYLSPTYENPLGRTVHIIGDLLQFRLAYNYGAAFSSRPQDILPFLPPTVFFLLISLVAVFVLVYFSRGALGNFADRMRLGKVVDFIDCDFPDFIMSRWPTFNFADCCVTVGVAIIILAPILYKFIRYVPEGSHDEKNGKSPN